MASAHRAGERHRPQRRPVAGRRSAPKESLIRFVLDEARHLVPDLQGRLPGRGLWLDADRRMLEAPATRRRLARMGVRDFDPQAVVGELERQLERRCLDLLGLAQRARCAVIGYEAVREALEADKAAVVIVARDASPHARKRFRHLPEGARRVELFDRAALGAALGREDVVYAALLPGKLARRFVEEIDRLVGLRPADAQGVGREPVMMNEDMQDHE